MQRVQLEPALVLHTIAYRNTSLIVDLLTHHHGRVSVVARSARGPKSRYKGQLQPFVPLLISYSGRTELKFLNQVELRARPYNLIGSTMLCGFYLNELLVRLVQKQDAHAELYDLYEHTLLQLQKNQNIEINLRLFEKKLLAELGYGLPLDIDIATGDAILPGVYYRYITEQGFVSEHHRTDDLTLYAGESLLALANENISTPQHLLDAKRLMRQVLGYYLGSKPLKSRELFY